MNYNNIIIYQLIPDYLNSINSQKNVDNLAIYLHELGIPVLLLSQSFIHAKTESIFQKNGKEQSKINHTIQQDQPKFDLLAACQAHHLGILLEPNPNVSKKTLLTAMEHALRQGIQGFLYPTNIKEFSTIHANDALQPWLLLTTSTTNHSRYPSQPHQTIRLTSPIQQKKMSIPTLKQAINQYFSEWSNDNPQAIYFSIHQQRLLDCMGYHPLYRHESAKAYALLQFTIPGIPVILQTDELAISNKKPKWFQPTKMKHWLANQSAMQADNFLSSIHQAQQQPQSTALFYQQLCSLKNSHSALQDGTWESMLIHHKQVICYKRTHLEETLLVLINLSSTSTKVNFKQPMEGIHLCSNYPGHKELSRYMILIPYEGIVYQLDDVHSRDKSSKL